MERRLQKREYCQIYQQCFYLEDLTQVEWSIRKKQNNGITYETKVGDKEHYFDYCLNLIQMQSLDLSEYLLFDYQTLKDFQVFILQYTKKKTIKMYISVTSFFTG